MSVLRNQT